jgi:hypothetical protein
MDYWRNDLLFIINKIKLLQRIKNYLMICQSLLRQKNFLANVTSIRFFRMLYQHVFLYAKIDDTIICRIVYCEYTIKIDKYLELRHIRVSEFAVWLCATNSSRNASMSGEVLFVCQNPALTKFFSTVLATITDFGVFPSTETQQVKLSIHRQNIFKFSALN